MAKQSNKVDGQLSKVLTDPNKRSDPIAIEAAVLADADIQHHATSIAGNLKRFADLLTKLDITGEPLDVVVNAADSIQKLFIPDEINEESK